jgi:hypothetical protein
MENTPITIEQALALTGSKALEHFTNPETLEQLASQVRDEAIALSNAFNPETKSGREGIGSTALKVSKSRKVITDKLDQAAAKHKETLAKITTAKKQVEHKFKEIRTEVLRPRDEWQAEQDRIESERVAEIKQRIENIRRIGDFTDTDTKGQLSDKIETLNGIDASNGFEELYWDATNAIKEQIAKLHDRIVFVAQEAQRKKEQERIKMEREIAEIKQYPLLFIGKTYEEMVGVKLKINDLDSSRIIFAKQTANSQLDKIIGQAKRDTWPGKVYGCESNVSENGKVTKEFLNSIKSGEKDLYFVWVDVVETTESRRMYPVVAASEEEAKTNIEKSLEAMGDSLDYKESIINSKSAHIGEVVEVAKQ